MCLIFVDVEKALFIDIERDKVGQASENIDKVWNRLKRDEADKEIIPNLEGKRKNSTGNWPGARNEQRYFLSRGLFNPLTRLTSWSK